MRSEDEINHAVDVYGDTVKRICMLHLKNWADTEDIFQNVFLKYALTRKKNLKVPNMKKHGLFVSQSINVTIY